MYTIIIDCYYLNDLKKTRTLKLAGICRTTNFLKKNSIERSGDQFEPFIKDIHVKWKSPKDAFEDRGNL